MEGIQISIRSTEETQQKSLPMGRDHILKTTRCYWPFFYVLYMHFFFSHSEAYIYIKIKKYIL